jgi:hypothetical protein
MLDVVFLLIIMVIVIMLDVMFLFIYSKTSFLVQIKFITEDLQQTQTQTLIIN